MGRLGWGPGAEHGLQRLALHLEGRARAAGIALHLYVCSLCALQARDDILNGSHPVSFDKACEFAGFQCQIQFGPHNEQKHKPGFLE